MLNILSYFQLSAITNYVGKNLNLWFITLKNDKFVGLRSKCTSLANIETSPMLSRHFISYMCISHDFDVMYVITCFGINLCEIDGSFS